MITGPVSFQPHTANRTSPRVGLCCTFRAGDRHGPQSGATIPAKLICRTVGCSAFWACRLCNGLSLAEDFCFLVKTATSPRCQEAEENKQYDQFDIDVALRCEGCLDGSCGIIPDSLSIGFLFTSFLLPKVFRITTSQVVGCLILWPLCLQDHQGILPCLQQLALKPSKLVASSALC